MRFCLNSVYEKMLTCIIIVWIIIIPGRNYSKNIIIIIIFHLISNLIIILRAIFKVIILFTFGYI